MNLSGLRGLCGKPIMLSCIHPLAVKILIALAVTLALCLPASGILRFGRNKPVIAIIVLMAGLTLWLGSYAYSPLGFANGRIPILNGFALTRLMRGNTTIQPGEIISISRNSVVGLSPLTFPVEMDCIWFSVNGGALDDPSSCDTAYIPPGNADFDTLKLLIQPSCRLPNVTAQIRISILP
jgi:hypothetical protein